MVCVSGVRGCRCEWVWRLRGVASWCPCSFTSHCAIGGAICCHPAQPFAVPHPSLIARKSHALPSRLAMPALHLVSCFVSHHVSHLISCLPCNLLSIPLRILLAYPAASFPASCLPSYPVISLCVPPRIPPFLPRIQLCISPRFSPRNPLLRIQPRILQCLPPRTPASHPASPCAVAAHGRIFRECEGNRVGVW